MSRADLKAAAEAVGGGRPAESRANRSASGPRRARSSSRCIRSSTARLTDLRNELNCDVRRRPVRPRISFLARPHHGRYTELELDEDYRPRWSTTAIPRRVISGGEEDVANLALRLAISQMIAERAGQPLSLLVLDEVFGSLDEERRGQ